MDFKPHTKYFSYVVRHKYFVFRAGLKTKAPIWRLIIHDWSKFSLSEWKPYVEAFYGPKLLSSNMLALRKDRFDKAWLHHQHKNPHHWQHYVLRKDDGAIKCIKIPEKFVREMVADWCGAGRAITGEWEVRDWYETNRHKILLHPATQIQVVALINIVHLKLHDESSG